MERNHAVHYQICQVIEGRNLIDAVAYAFDYVTSLAWKLVWRGNDKSADDGRENVEMGTRAAFTDAKG